MPRLQVAILCLLLGACAGTYRVRAREEARQTQNFTTVIGRVGAVTYAPAGRVDGFFFENGLRVHFPPVADEQVLSVAPSGQRVEVRGWTHWDGDNAQTVEAYAIRNIQSGQSLDLTLASTAVLTPPVAFGGSGTPLRPDTATGQLTEFTYDRTGSVTGLLLDTGRRIRFPPSQTGRIEGFVRSGQRLRVVGWDDVDERGAPVVRAGTLINLDAGLELNIASGGVAPIPPPPEH